MPQIVVSGGQLVVRLSPLEKLAAFRGDVTVPASAVASVRVDSDPWKALRGIRSPGTGLPKVIAYGTRRLTGARPDFAALRGTGPALVIDLDDAAPFGRLVLTMADPERTAAELEAELTPEAR